MADRRSRLKRWLLFDGDRAVIAVLLLAGIFLALVGLGLAGVIDVEDREAVRGVATGFVPGLIAFLSIVLGINQLVLSQEFGSAGEIRDRIRNVREYRHDIEELAGIGPSPVLPVGFLAFVVLTIRSEAETLAESVGPDVDAAVAEPIETYTRSVIEEATRAHESLESLDSGRINALLSVLEYADSYQLYEVRRLQREHGDALPAEARESLSHLIEALELFSVARTQFRTTYTQRVLARLSRHLLYVGIPALVVAVVLGLTPASSGPLGTGAVGLVTVSALYAVALAPLAVLSAYLLRVAAVSERTIAAGPFVSRPGAAPTDRSSVEGERAFETEGRGTDATSE